MPKKKRGELDAIEDFKERQEYYHDPGKFTGGRESPAVYVLRRSPIIMLLLGMAGALGVLIDLAVSDFDWSQAIILVPVLAVSALLIYGGAARLKKK